jgi:hypothetical protein
LGRADDTTVATAAWVDSGLSGTNKARQMDTDEQPAHFAWDLLDAAKQVALTQVADARATSETNAPDTEAQGLALPPDASPIVGHQVEPAALSIMQPEPEAGEPPPVPLQLDPTSEMALSSAHPLGPGSGIPPIIEPLPATATIDTEASTKKEEPSSPQVASEATAKGLPTIPRGPTSASPTTWCPRSSVSSDGDIPKLRWDDIGKTTEPGQHKSRYGLIHVRADEIRIWKTYPNAAFAVMQPSPYSDQNVSRLGSFDVGQLTPIEG